MPATKNSIRQVDIRGSLGHPAEENSELPIILEEIRTNELDEILIEDKVNYPYRGQSIIQGEYKYSHEGFLGVASAEGTFQIRTGSNLVVVQQESGSAKIETIIEALDDHLDEQLGSDISIHEAFSPSRSNTWEFVESVTWVSSLRVRRGGEDINISSLVDDSDLDFDDVAYQDQIAYADLVFETPWGEPVNVIYDDGRLEISTVDEDLYEYVIQIFETHMRSE